MYAIRSYYDYQPKFNSVTGEFTGLEALARWQHPDRGLVWPVHFISLAEETGMIVPLGEMALRLACTQNRQWQDRGFKPFRVAVNLSAQQFEERDLVDTVYRTLKETGLSPQSLDRITSYNVCYTKLLRIPRDGYVLAEGESKHIGRLVIPPKVFAALQVETTLWVNASLDYRARIILDDYPRITSYNVCYTKLLRSSINPFFRSLQKWRS